MLLELRAHGALLASRELAGPLLVVPPGTTAVRRTPRRTVIEPTWTRSDLPDLLVGSVPLVWFEPRGRTVELSFLEVPPPPPFASKDVEEMWRRLLSSDLPLLRSAHVQGLSGGAAEAGSDPLSIHQLPAAIAACRRMLQRWPGDERREVVWRPADMRGGREDLRLTEARAGRRGGVVLDDLPLPDRIARRQRGSLAWQSRRLAAACLALTEKLVEVAPDDRSPLLTEPFEAVAARALTNQPDVPTSSWPLAARSAYKAVLGAYVGLAVAADGAAHVPLADLWRIYEAWVALQILAALEGAFGPPATVSVGPPWTGEWVVSGCFLRLHLQREIGSSGDPASTGHPDGIRSVSSDLRPDALVAVWLPGGGQTVICFDAKRRTAGTKMDPAEVASAASKYLWGIRTAADPGEFPVSSTVVVSSAPVAEMHDAAASRISAHFLLPSIGGESFASLVQSTVRSAVEKVRS